MSARTRAVLALCACVVLGGPVAVGLLDMPAAGQVIAPYGVLMTELAVAERHAMNAVSAVLFDIRSFDTLAELLALFTASAGLHVIFRRLGGEHERDEPKASRRDRAGVPVSVAMRALCFALAAPIAMYGVFITVRAHLSAGGGFQGGIVITAAVFLLYLAGRPDIQEGLADETRLDFAEAVAMAGYVVMGLAGLALAGALFANVLPIGEPGALLSAGGIVLLSVLVAIDAAAATTLLISHQQDEVLEREGGP